MSRKLELYRVYEEALRDAVLAILALEMEILEQEGSLSQDFRYFAGQEMALANMQMALEHYRASLPQAHSLFKEARHGKTT